MWRFLRRYKEKYIVLSVMLPCLDGKKRKTTNILVRDGSTSGLPFRPMGFAIQKEKLHSTIVVIGPRSTDAPETAFRFIRTNPLFWRLPTPHTLMRWALEEVLQFGMEDVYNLRITDFRVAFGFDVSLEEICRQMREKYDPGYEPGCSKKPESTPTFWAR